MKNSKKSGFTMVEIIAVLVIIGIMTAVAAPKFINMAQEAKDKAVLAGISEAKASLSVGYAKAYLTADGISSNINASAVMTACTFADATPEEFGDVQVTFDSTATGSIGLDATGIAGSKLVDATATGTWTVPVQ